ncbi:hypothetical protein F2Q70_00044614 [Brassica cretica]|uniref:Calmodulin binding protein-like N-terminal domain-containing protein n=1 Tax=Brassica cretica TaxID=69181 RepID=A0A8S9KIV7_BRACR|nr:hypothetical protein F2Q70_00044614 [Brassica cretica]
MFAKNLKKPIFTGSKIIDEDNNPLQIILVNDSNNDHYIAPVNLDRPIRLDIVALHGDFPSGDKWSSDEFDRNIVKERDGKRPLLAGDVTVTVRNGVGTIGDIEFTDNSSWIRSRKFKIGVKVAKGSSGQGVAVCEAMTEAFNVRDHRGEYFDDEKLYRTARLVTAAVIAKVHTIDWTIELLKTDTLTAGMRINWYGFLGKKVKDTIGARFGPILSGLVGMKKPRDHGVPYSLTEEFVSVYRMHCLLPDTLSLRHIRSESVDKANPAIEREVPMTELIGKEGGTKDSRIGFEQLLVSMGHQSCGALTLWNYPNWMRNLVAQDINGDDRTNLIDMAALEIYRDRERGVPRYNEFRKNLLMSPINKWEDLTDSEEAIKVLKEVYEGDIDKLDLNVGLHAEKKIKGFAISETAFFIFLLVASRRLEADRFFTTNFNEKTYTKEGLEWVNTTESLKDVIDRHFPSLTNKWMRCTSAFSVWSSDPDPTNWLPLYLRSAP